MARFSRVSPRREQRKRFLIVVEGEVTECDYFHAIRKSRSLPKELIQVEPPPPTSPLEIVRKAVRLRDEQRERDPYDEVWCVFDVEAQVTQPARPNLQEALTLAEQKQIKIALSNPCFELWLLLHHQDCTAWIASHDVQTACSKSGIVEDKKILKVADILRLHGQAKSRAEKLCKTHNRNDTDDPAERNPETTVHRLVDAIYAAFPQA